MVGTTTPQTIEQLEWNSEDLSSLGYDKDSQAASEDYSEDYSEDEDEVEDEEQQDEEEDDESPEASSDGWTDEDGISSGFEDSDQQQSVDSLLFDNNKTTITSKDVVREKSAQNEDLDADSVNKNDSQKARARQQVNDTKHDFFDDEPWGKAERVQLQAFDPVFGASHRDDDDNDYDDPKEAGRVLSRRKIITITVCCCCLVLIAVVGIVLGLKAGEKDITANSRDRL
jgi:hypothetical protein